MGLGDVPLHLVLDLVVAGTRLAIAAADWSAEILDGRRRPPQRRHLAARTSPTPVELAGRDACYDDGEWRWAGDGEPADATRRRQGRLRRAPLFDADRTPVGPSVGQRGVDFWRFADAELGTDLGPLTAAVDVTSSGRRRSSTRP